ncbi:RidA family protein [Burkholderia lata]|uniref:RidA family protein n=1 Tax=Burkholderia lata (strain ATCC 17760 / DSM 23089 / LMG 22485 / NCIMB 9086 / R18194 / 383) TaxID=482957 RepID=UPI0015813BB5|nr:RidA family protein [Burkholderia lata]
MTQPHLSPSVRSGEIIFTSGQLAFDAEGHIEGDVVHQTRVILQRIASLLASSGLGLTDIGKTTVWLRRASDFEAFNAAYASVFGTHRPARSTVVCGLTVPEALVEIEAVAWSGGRA